MHRLRFPLFPLLFRTLSVALACAAMQSHAQSAYPLTPQLTNVEAGQSQVFAARFLDALGQPAAHQTVTFRNDACGAFAGGGFAVDVQTDADGVASTTFTARFPGGVTCWLTATGAGSSVRFDVVTYNVNQLGFGATPVPGDPRPGQPFALNVSVGIFSYALRRVEVSVRIVPGAATASVSPAVANTGDGGVAAFQIVPQGPMGSYEIEIGFRGRTWRIPMSGSYQDAWWGGIAENGWGMSLAQRGDTLVAGWYRYDSAGRATWLIMPGCTWDAARVACSGSLVAATGAWLGNYDATRLAQTTVGSATLSFADASNATFTFTVNGVAGQKQITRMRFGEGDARAIDYSGVWWGGAGENGWGLALTQQRAVLAGAWYTFDRAGRATWYVIGGGAWTGPATYEAPLTAATGAPMPGGVYDPDAFQPVQAGAVSLTFLDADNAVMRYTVDGVTQTRTISRQRF